MLGEHVAPNVPGDPYANAIFGSSLINFSKGSSR